MNVGLRDLLVLQKISLLEIVSTAVLLAVVVESSVLLAKLHFKLPTGANLLLVEC